MSSSIRVGALDPIGAEVSGLDLDAGLSDAGFAALRAALLEHGVLVLCGQSLRAEQQVALGRRFGPIEGHEFIGSSPHPDLIVISNVGKNGEVLPRTSTQMRSIAINEQWHTDSSFRPTPASVSIFSARVVPPEGGDTLYASLRLGWQELDPVRRLDVAGLRAVHDYAKAYRREGGHWPPGLNLDPVSHPMVRAHPETGDPGLYVSRHAFRVEGMPDAEGRALIEALVGWCTREGRVYRHRWSPGDVVLWDNRQMLHRAQGFDETHARTMHHVRVAGDGPALAFAR